MGQDLKFLIEMVIFERLIFKNDTNYDRSEKIVELFAIEGEVKEIKPLGNGLINDTYKVVTEGGAPDYVLQRINNAIFTDVDLLQGNIEAVTRHIRKN